MTTIIIRPAASSDVQAMVDLLHQLFTIEADFDFSAARQQRGLELLLAAPGAKIMVAEKKGGVIGMVTGQLMISTAEGGPSLLVEDLVVLPDQQKQGIGSALLEELAGWAQSLGASRMQLLADRNNSPALLFYRHQGWQETQLICLRKFPNKELLP